MRKAITIIWMAFALLAADSCATHQGASSRVWANPDGLCRLESNSLAVVQILLVSEDRLITGGSGFFVNEDGYLVTAYHVIEPARANPIIRTLVNFNNTLYPATTLAYDEAKDLAVVRASIDGQVPYVRFASTDALVSRSRLTFIAVPPTWGSFNDGSFLTGQNRMSSENHNMIIIRNLKELMTDPDTMGFIQDELVRNIIFDPVTASLVADPATRNSLPYPRATIDLLTFFLADRESRIFFSDPDQRTRSGCSGGAAFNEIGLCVGMLQEILAVFKPNPKSRYIFPDRPPADNGLFPILDRMICAGQNAYNIRAFLARYGIVHEGDDEVTVDASSPVNVD